MTIEFRTGVELRAIGGRKLVGIAAPYDVPAQIGPFTEVLRRGCWAASLAAGNDIVALQDHDTARLLGRVKSGSLVLADEQRGLGFTLTLPDTGAGRDVHELAARGDLGGCSVGMRVVDQSWPSPDRREIRGAELVEISIVSAFPAYPSTEVALRSRDQAVRQLNALARRRLLEML